DEDASLRRGMGEVDARDANVDPRRQVEVETDLALEGAGPALRGAELLARRLELDDRGRRRLGSGRIVIDFDDRDRRQKPDPRADRPQTDITHMLVRYRAAGTEHFFEPGRGDFRNALRYRKRHR